MGSSATLCGERATADKDAWSFLNDIPRLVLLLSFSVAQIFIGVACGGSTLSDDFGFSMSRLGVGQ